MFPRNKKPTGENSRKQYADAEALIAMLREKNKEIELLKKQLKLSDEYSRNLRDLLRELVRILAIIDQ